MNKTQQDTVFDNLGNPVGDFTFNAKVADVFDDMVSRSVPFYAELQRMTSELVRDFVKPKSRIYDIGCSTATTLLAIFPAHSATDSNCRPRIFEIHNSSPCRSITDV